MSSSSHSRILTVQSSFNQTSQVREREKERERERERERESTTIFFILQVTQIQHQRPGPGFKILQIVGAAAVAGVVFSALGSAIFVYYKRVHVPTGTNLITNMESFPGSVTLTEA
eukprot:sb/3476729/